MRERGTFFTQRNRGKARGNREDIRRVTGDCRAALAMTIKMVWKAELCSLEDK